MADLFMMDFARGSVKVNNIYKKEDLLADIKEESPEKCALPKVVDTYGELLFPKASENRPYTFCSVVLSSDGKMAFTDSQEGPLIAKNNYLDPDGSLADFWMLNVLRAYADGIIIGARTLQSEALATSHVFDNELAEQRVKYLDKKMHPWNIIVSFDATDIPFEHLIFNIDDKDNFKVFIATSPEGQKYIKENSPLKHISFGPYNSTEEVDIAAIQSKLDENKDAVPVFITGKDSCPDSDVLLYILRKLGLERLCIESPSYNWHLMKNKALDEYFIDYSFVFAGGNITPGYSMPFGNKEHPHADLLTVGIHKSNFIFTRQKMHYDVSSSIDLSKFKY